MSDQLRMDSHKLGFHPERVARWMRGELTYPIYVEIGPTSACNHRCIFCALDYTGYKGDFIDSTVMKNCLQDMGKHGVKSVMFGGEGEPFLHKELPQMVAWAKENNMDTAVTTNGVPFTADKAEKCLPFLSWIKISMDAGTQETYTHIHGAKADDFKRLLDNIKKAVEIRDKNNYSAKIGIQLLLINENFSEVLGLAERAREMGTDYFVVKPYSPHPGSFNKLTFDYRQAEALKDSLEKLNTESFQAVFRLGTMKKLHVETPYTDCHGLNFFALIDARGNVLPCNLYYNKETYYYGNINRNTFSEIWSSSRREEVLGKLKQEGVGDCRKNCRLDAVNRYLHPLKNPPEHVNFI